MSQPHWQTIYRLHPVFQWHRPKQCRPLHGSQSNVCWMQGLQGKPTKQQQQCDHPALVTQPQVLATVARRACLTVWMQLGQKNAAGGRQSALQLLQTSPGVRHIGPHLRGCRHSWKVSSSHQNNVPGLRLPVNAPHPSFSMRNEAVVCSHILAMVFPQLCVR